MISTIFIAEKFQIGAGLSGYVAEIGAAFLCSDLGITQDVRPDHAQYLAHWLQLLKEDDHAIFAAAARASEAVTFLEGGVA